MSQVIGVVVGDSAYEIAVKGGFVGTEAQWLESLKADSVDLSAIESAIQDLDNSKVDKVNGKQLSTEDFTTAEKTKLAGLSDNPSGGIEEAPKDGKQYARQNGAWSAVSSSGGSYDDTEVRNLITENTNDINDLDINKADKTQIPDVSGFATKTELNQGLSSKQPIGSYATTAQLADKVDKTTVATQTTLGLVKIWVSGTTGYISTE